MTNAEYIKSMTNDALAQFLFRTKFACPPFKSAKELGKACKKCGNCLECWLGWLNEKRV